MRNSQTYIQSSGLSIQKPSLTVPDQSLSLRNLLTNYTRGQDLPYGKQQPAFFDEDTYIPDLKKMDLVDLQEYAEGNAHKAAMLQNELDAHAAKKAEESLNLEVEKRLQNRTKPQPNENEGGGKSD